MKIIINPTIWIKFLPKNIMDINENNNIKNNRNNPDKTIEIVLLKIITYHSLINYESYHIKTLGIPN